jgi:drug/metabolite transporter (DMT)-like permease
MDSTGSPLAFPVNSTQSARLSLFPAVVAVSSSAIFVRLAIAPLGDAPPLAAAFWRGAIAGLAFLPVLFWARYRSQLLAIRARDFWSIAAATTVIATHQICFISSLRYTSVAASTFLTSTQPIFTALLGGLLIREHVTARNWLAIAGAIGGMAIITFSKPVAGNAEPLDPLLGNGLALLAALLASLYTLAARRLRQRVPIVPFMLILHASGSVFLILIIGLTGTNVAHYSSQTWMGLLLLGLIPTLLGHSLLNYAVGHLRAFVVNAVILGEPVGATIMAAVFLNEAASWQTLIGGALIIACILFIVLERPAPEAAAGAETV